MGLPLFVAPSESSQTSKANKTASTSPPRTGIRRLASPESRDHRTRRITRIHDALNRYSSSGNNDEGSDSADQLGPARRAGFRITPRNDQTLSSAILGLGSEPPTRPNQDVMTREALRISSRPEDRRRERIEERMQSLFGSAWRDLQRDSSYEALGLNDNEQDADVYVSRTGGRFPRRARIVAPASSRFDRSPDRRSPGRFDALDEYLPSYPGYPHPDPGRQVDEDIQAAVNNAREAQLRYHSRQSARERQAAQPTSRSRRGLDGLGDRDRSLSPDWDMLLTTLTPDPQPPSASSSFASAAASQSAGASSHTTPPTTEPSGSTAAEPPCESGFENSDGEEPDYEHPDFARIRRRRDQVRRETPGPHGELNREGRPWSTPGTAAIARRLARIHASNATLSDQIRSLWNDEPADGTSRPVEPIRGMARQRDPWVGRLSVGASDDEQRGDRTRSHAEGPNSLARATLASEEDWPGMRRIVRSMAMREDIPDEWWAEAGLSRTLPRDEAN